MTDNINNYSVLIVDDVPKNIQVVANILKGEGYHMAFAKDGARALKMARNNRFDLILLDIMMPGMDGYEVCNKLKQSDATKDIPVIFLTAKTDTESIVKGFDAGAVDYVTKPFNGKELLSRVKTHLRLMEANQCLLAANSTKDKFFSIIAHDLKGPFNTILGFSELLLMGYDRYEDDKIKHYIKRIYQSTRSTYNLLENLLEWARLNTGRIVPKPDSFDLFKVAENVFSVVSSSAIKKEIALINKVPEKTGVYADEDMIMFVIRNLVSNAIKFTGKGGAVEITTQPADTMVEVTVKDSGIGISKEDAAMLFTIGSHKSREGTAGEKGTGLGLMLCSEFVKFSGGDIWVSSEQGGGSRFKFTLPSGYKSYLPDENMI